MGSRVSGKKILFVHQNFPGQFPHIVSAVLAAGHKVAAIGGQTAKGIPGVDVRRWKLDRGSTTGIFELATRAEADYLRGHAAAHTARALRDDGFIPDLIIVHPGWGEAAFLGEVFPEARQILFGEFFYKSHGADVFFDPEYESHTLNADMKVHAKNAVLALSCATADVVVCPTPFQAGTYPQGLQSQIRVFHEGVDTSKARKKSGARLKLPNGKILDGSTPVITFINRDFERLRGFHIFMRALPAFLDRCPGAQVVVIGADSGKGYGAALPNGETWKQRMLAEVGDRLDQSRVHFMGRVEHSDMISALSISWGHVYYTYPFVLSWSLVEAMACECLILGSDTGPVQDAITPGENGVLIPFFDVAALSDAMARACEEPEVFAAMRVKAKETALRLYDRDTAGIPAWMALINEMLALGHRPPR